MPLRGMHLNDSKLPSTTAARATRKLRLGRLLAMTPLAVGTFLVAGPAASAQDAPIAHAPRPTVCKIGMSCSADTLDERRALAFECDQNQGWVYVDESGTGIYCAHPETTPYG